MLRETLLIENHERSAAEVGEFAGWRTAIIYSNTRREHLAVRRSVGIFDVSHMKRSIIKGKDSAKFLSRILTIDAERMKRGRMKYCLMLNDDAGIIDDLTVMRLSDDEFLITSNAATSKRVDEWMVAHAIGDVGVEDVTDSSSLIAIQGPSSRQLVDELLSLGVSSLKWFSFTQGTFCGLEVIVSRSGYTGEDGFEIYLRSDDPQISSKLWERCIELGAEPCGLATRDILRLECGYPLSQVDIDESITPVEGRLTWAVEGEGHIFIGREAYVRRLKEGPRIVLVGVLMVEGGVPRRGMVINSRGRAGIITSGALSYSLGRGIALAHVEPVIASDGEEVYVDIRGSARRAKIKLGPFLSHIPVKPT